MGLHWDIVAMLFGGPVGRGLGRTARGQGWPMVRPGTMREAIEVVLIRRPRVVVAQLPGEAGLGLAVVGRLHQRGKVMLLAVAEAEIPQLERRARAAGVHCYLPADAKAVEVLGAARLLLSRSMGQEHPRDAPTGKGEEGLLEMGF